jgi:hypothetical protein
MIDRYTINLVKNHFKRDTKTQLIYSGISLIILVLTTLILSSAINKYYAFYQSINQYRYQTSVEYINAIKENNLYYKFTDLSVLKDNKSHMATVIKYMELDDTTYNEISPINQSTVISGAYRKLKSNEIALSENIANDLKVKVGDQVSMKQGLSSTNSWYTVSYIYNYSIDFYAIDQGSNFGTILLGYDEAYYNRTKEKFVVFYEAYNHETHLKYFNDLYDYKYYDRIDDLKSNLLILAIYLLVYLIVLIGSIIGLNMINGRLLVADYHKYKKYGYPKQVVYNLMKFDLTVLLLIPNLLLTALLLIYSIISNQPFVIPNVILLISFISIIISYFLRRAKIA